jgi:hypothetical protein
MKASVIQKRAEQKDYIDLHALIAHGVDLRTALSAASIIYGSTFNPQTTLKALAFYEDGGLAGLPDGLKSDLKRAAASADLDSLPVLTPAKARSPMPGRRQ